MTEEYQEYLNSPIWWEKRDRILERDGWQCRKCGSGMNLRVHHIRYPEVLGEEPDSDLITLCDDCHKSVHEQDLRKKQQLAEKIREKQLATDRWKERVKKKDFLWGGTENMCRLDLLRKDKQEYIAETNCEMFGGVGEIQFYLGMSHRLLVNELYRNGYSLDEIDFILPLERQRIKDYLEGKEFSTWEYGSEEIWNQIDAFIENDSKHRKGK